MYHQQSHYNQYGSDSSQLPYLNQANHTSSSQRQLPLPQNLSPYDQPQQQQQQQQQNHRVGAGSIGSGVQQLQYQTSNNSLHQQYRNSHAEQAMNGMNAGHVQSTYAPSSPGASSFLTVSERRMSRDSVMDDITTLDSARRDSIHSDVYNNQYRSPISHPHHSASNISLQNSISSGISGLRRGSTSMDPLRRPHIAPPIFTQGVSTGGMNSMSSPISAGGDPRRSGNFGVSGQRTYPYPHPNANEPTPGFPYAFPDPSMEPLPTSAHSQSSSQLAHTQSLSDPRLSSLQNEDNTPYSRSPELRVSHKLAERKRRREMKDLFDDLRDKLPLDRTLKTSKWEILSKACEHLSMLEEENQSLKREIAELRRGT